MVNQQRKALWQKCKFKFAFPFPRTSEQKRGNKGARRMSVQGTPTRILALAILKANKGTWRISPSEEPLNIHSTNIYCGRRGDHSDQDVQGLRSQGANVRRMKRGWVGFSGFFFRGMLGGGTVNAIWKGCKVLWRHYWTIRWKEDGGGWFSSQARQLWAEIWIQRKRNVLLEAKHSSQREEQEQAWKCWHVGSNNRSTTWAMIIIFNFLGATFFNGKKS